MSRNCRDSLSIRNKNKLLLFFEKNFTDEEIEMAFGNLLLSTTFEDDSDSL